MAWGLKSKCSLLCRSIALNTHRVDCECIQDVFGTKWNLRLLAHCPHAFSASERCTWEIVNRVKWMWMHTDWGLGVLCRLVALTSTHTHTGSQSGLVLTHTTRGTRQAGQTIMYFKKKSWLLKNVLSMHWRGASREGDKRSISFSFIY